MARPTFAETQLLVSSLLADNTTGAITPADVRQVFDAVSALFQPAACGLTGIPAAAIALTTTDTKLTVFDAALPEIGETGVIVPNIANDDVTTSLVGVHRVDVTIEAEGPNNDDLIVTLYRDGVATAASAEVALRGNGNKVELIVAYPLRADAPGPHTYDVRARLRVGTGSVTFANSVLAVSYVPGQ